MSNEIDSAGVEHDRYFLEDRERWESLGLDWEGWNATIAKILQQRALVNSRKQQEDSAEGIPG